MTFVLFQGIQVNQEVIEICNEKVIEIFSERIINKVLKGPRGVAEAEWHDLVFEQSVTRTERCLPLLPRRHAKEVITIAHIELREALSQCCRRTDPTANRLESARTDLGFRLYIIESNRLRIAFSDRRIEPISNFMVRL
jgi:hypothetical protein